MSDDASEDNWIFDSLVNFLHGNIWKIPVLGFIEDKSVVFDPDSHANLSEEKEEEFHKIHEEYKTLVDFMLSSFMDDLQVTPTQVEEACQQREKLSNIAESHITKVALEQLQAAEDFNVFRRIMTRKNIDLQLQSLELLVAKYGVLSPSLRSDGSENLGDGDEDFLQVVIRYCGDDGLYYGSDVYHHNRAKDINHSCTSHPSPLTSAEVLKNVEDFENHSTCASDLSISTLKLDTGAKCIPRLHETMQPRPHDTHLQSKPLAGILQIPALMATTELSSGTSSQLIQQDLEDSEKASRQESGTIQDATALENDISSSTPPPARPTRVDAKSRKKESKMVKFDETTVAEIATNAPEQHRILTSVRKALEVDAVNDPEALPMNLDMTGSEEDIEKRRAYLRAQRDKLVALRKRERERQLEVVAGGSQERPKSARAAQMAMRTPPSASNKSLAARRALAARLKHELLDK